MPPFRVRPIQRQKPEERTQLGAFFLFPEQFRPIFNCVSIFAPRVCYRVGMNIKNEIAFVAGAIYHSLRGHSFGYAYKRLT